MRKRVIWAVLFLASTAGLIVSGAIGYYHLSNPERRGILRRLPIWPALYPPKPFAPTINLLEEMAEKEQPADEGTGDHSCPLCRIVDIGNLLSPEAERVNLPFCTLAPNLSCEKVANSPYAIFLGIPVPVWGILGYLQFVFLSLWGLAAGGLPRPALTYWKAITAFAFLFTAYLNGLEAFVIRAWCAYCIANAFVVLLLSGTTLAFQRHLGSSS